MNEEGLEHLWSAYTDIPIDEEVCIDEDFYIWSNDTDRFEIWHWFDEKLPNGVHQLLN